MNQKNSWLGQLRTGTLTSARACQEAFFQSNCTLYSAPPFPRSRIKFIFLVLVPFGHLTLCPAKYLFQQKAYKPPNYNLRRTKYFEETIILN